MKNEEEQQTKRYELNAFTVELKFDESGELWLNATNKAKNFQLRWAGTQAMSSVLPEVLSKDDDNVMAYVELFLTMAYSVCTTPMSVDTYVEILNAMLKEAILKSELQKDDLPDNDLQEDLAIARMQTDIQDASKIDRMLQDSLDEIERNLNNS